MSLTYSEALGKLSSIEHTLDKLFELVQETSGEVVGATSGSTYLLNSGKLPDGTLTSEVLSAMQNSGAGISVGQSHVGKLLNNTEVFLPALRKAVKLDVLGSLDIVPDADQISSLTRKLNLVLKGIDTFDNNFRVPNANSMWDFASENYVKDAIGDF